MTTSDQVAVLNPEDTLLKHFNILLFFVCIYYIPCILTHTMSTLYVNKQTCSTAHCSKTCDDCMCNAVPMSVLSVECPSLVGVGGGGMQWFRVPPW